MTDPSNPIPGAGQPDAAGLGGTPFPPMTRRHLLVPDLNGRAPEPAQTMTVVSAPAAERPRSLGQDAWAEMRHRPLFWIASALVLLFVVMAVFPQLFTSANPMSCPLSLSRQPPRPGAIFGNDMQGCDIFARTVYGARASIIVGVGTALAAALIGGTLGTLAGYLGGWVDAILSRTADIFFAIPLLMAAIVAGAFVPVPPAASLPRGAIQIVAILAIFGWPNIYRLMRASVLQVKSQEFVLAARALGANPLRLITSHIVPNSLTPLIVVSTIDLGGYITTEAAMSLLGVGYPSTVISWGGAIAKAAELGLIRNAPHMLLFPAAALCLAVLAFIMLGEVVRDAFDPKTR